MQNRITIPLAGAVLAAAALIFAPPADAGSCTVPSGSYPTIQSAVDDNGCDPIDILAGTYSGSVDVGRNVTIQGAGGRGVGTTLDGGGTTRPLEVSGAGVVVTVRDLRVTDGNGTGLSPTTMFGGRLGGGIVVHDGATLNLVDVRVDSSVANTSSGFGFGGGVAVFEATLDALRVQVDGNVASTGSGSGAGGGIAVVAGSATIDDSTIAMNTAKGAGGSGIGNGGGLYASADAGSGIAQLTVTGSSIVANVAYAAAGGTNDGVGGGLFLNDSVDSILISTNNDWEDNIARATGAGIGEGMGGGLAVQLEGSSTASVTIAGDDLRRNIANDVAGLLAGDLAQGGGIFLDADTPLAIDAVFENVDLIDNEAKPRGGQVAGQGGGLYANNVDLTGTTRGGGVGWDGGLVRGNVAASGHVGGDNADGQGGGMRLLTSPMVARDLEIVDNIALVDFVGGTGSGRGGGIYQFNGNGAASGRIDLTNSIVSGNVAKAEGTVDQVCTVLVMERRGSQIYSNNQRDDTDASALEHVTLAAATSTENEAVFLDAGRMDAVNTIFANHCFAYACDGCDNDSSEDYSLFFGLDDNADPHNALFINPGPNSVIGDPLFVDAADGDYRIQAASAAVDQGTNSGETVDIDGQPRPNGPGFDIGADEYLDEMPIFADGFESGNTTMWD